MGSLLSWTLRKMHWPQKRKHLQLAESEPHLMGFFVFCKQTVCLLAVNPSSLDTDKAIAFKPPGKGLLLPVPAR